MDSRKGFATVELRGQSRGQMIVDWSNSLKKEANVCLVLGLDNELYGQILMDAMHYCKDN